MPRTAPLSPDALAQARAILNVKAASDPDIREIRNAWAYLKSQRGQPVRPALLAPTHLITPPAQMFPPTPAPTLAEVQRRTHLRSLHYMRSRGITPRSDRIQPDLGGAA